MYRRYAHPLVRPLVRLALYRLTNAVNQLPRPLDSPQAHASGTDPDRILLFGSGPVVGYGVLSHDLALPGQLARQISAATGRGVDVDVVVDPDIVVQSARASLAELDLWRYDSIVVSIGANNSLLLTSLTTWHDELSALVEHLMTSTATATGIYLVAVPPINSIDVTPGWWGRLSERHTRRMNAESRRIAARSSRVTFIPFSPLVKADFTRYRTATTYQQWASVIAAPLITDLGRESAAGGSAPRFDEPARQQALDLLGILDSDAEERFDRIAALATQLFGVDQTLISFIDRDRVWIKAASNRSLVASTDLPRAGSFADQAMREAPPFVVIDASLDPRFVQHESVRADDLHLRFYAAYPIESPFGERIGMISVLARAPRDWTEGDTKLLRDLALMVQRELSVDEARDAARDG